MAEKVAIDLTVNGARRAVRVHPMARLLDVLRENLGLTGTKEGCGEGECGACAVLIDGALANSCLVPALAAQGAAVTTIEGVAAPRGGGGEESPPGDRLHPLQEAFLRSGGAQCGMCTPGMIMASMALMQRTGGPTEDDLRRGLAGNLCRCTGYVKIFDAVREACEKTRGGA